MSRQMCAPHVLLLYSACRAISERFNLCYVQTRTCGVAVKQTWRWGRGSEPVSWREVGWGWFGRGWGTSFPCRRKWEEEMLCRNQLDRSRRLPPRFPTPH
ncbi:hypothetical protein IE53DRAFT_255954 [Violaceomyces palustris]|uniref:Uncharacterized protein n=1 Tax=Violaceomyces palustris TaxID=1673888 RepID=A0ACD0NND5_9BASI|nr:hypothetical protein IE53DRAFT_255954 [Violaceomyces palustris]